MFFSPWGWAEKSVHRLGSIPSSFIPPVFFKGWDSVAVTVSEHHVGVTVILYSPKVLCVLWSRDRDISLSLARDLEKEIFTRSIPTTTAAAALLADGAMTDTLLFAFVFVCVCVFRCGKRPSLCVRNSLISTKTRSLTTNCSAGDW